MNINTCLLRAKNIFLLLFCSMLLFNPILGHATSTLEKIQQAINSGNIEEARNIISRINVNAGTGMKGTTLLMRASRDGLTDVVTLILEKHPMIELHNNDGETALTFAARNGHTSTVKVLLDHKAPTGMRTNGGTTALMLAIFYEHMDTVHEILRRNLYQGERLDAAIYAAQKDRTAGLKVLIENDKELLTISDNDEITPLYGAITEGSIAAATMLLEYGTPVNQRYSDNSTPLMEAIFRNEMDIAKLILTYNPDLNLKNQYGNTALSRAVWGGYVEMTKILLDKGARLPDGRIKKTDNNAVTIAMLEEYATEAPKKIEEKYKDSYGYDIFKLGMSQNEVRLITRDKGTLENRTDARTKIQLTTFKGVYNFTKADDVAHFVFTKAKAKEGKNPRFSLFFLKDKLVLICAYLHPKDVDPTIEALEDKFDPEEVRYSRDMYKVVYIANVDDEFIYCLGDAGKNNAGERSGHLMVVSPETFALAEKRIEDARREFNKPGKSAL